MPAEEPWQAIARQIQTETDPHKLTVLADDLLRLLGEKRKKLERVPADQPAASPKKSPEEVPDPHRRRTGSG
jgi:hypothetical protein